MGKDFAHRGTGARQATTGRGAPGWVWLLVGVAIGFAGAAGYYVTRPAAGPGPAAADGGAEAPAAAKRNIAIPPKEPSRFAFYELLPNYEVVIPKETLRAPPKSAAPAAGGNGEQYLIQVGSFQARREAEQQKANLALLGIESRVEQVTIDNDQTWFRVRIGPERGAARVNAILAQLDENGIEALVMKLPP